MKKQSKVLCKGCKHPILQKTAQKYNGFSRVCQLKDLAKNKTVEKTELSRADILFYLQKTKITFPKIYLFEEFVKIWALSGDVDFARNRYDLYLAKIQNHISALEKEISLPLLRQQMEVLV